MVFATIVTGVPFNKFDVLLINLCVSLSPGLLSITPLLKLIMYPLMHHLTLAMIPCCLFDSNLS